MSNAVEGRCVPSELRDFLDVMAIIAYVALHSTGIRNGADTRAAREAAIQPQPS